MEYHEDAFYFVLYVLGTGLPHWVTIQMCCVVGFPKSQGPNVLHVLKLSGR